MAKRQTENARDRLLSAMETRIREVGPSAAAMKDVLAQAGASPGSLYHFFPEGKDELAAAAVRRAGEAGAELLRSVLASSPSVADATEDFYAAVAVEHQREDFRYGCPVGMPATESPGVSEQIRTAAAESLESWARILAEALVSEGWPPDDATEAGRFAIAAYEGASAFARASRDVAPLHATSKVVAAHLRRCE